MPTVDSSDKSNLPVQHDQRLGEHDERKRRRRAENADQGSHAWRKLGLTNAPMASSERERGQQREIDESVLRVRPRARARSRRRCADADACARPWACAAPNADWAHYSSWRLTPSTGCNQIMVLPAGGKFRRRWQPRNITRTRSQVRRSSSSPDTTSTGLAFFAHAIHDGEQRFLRFHVDARRRVDQHQHVSGWWRARAITTFCSVAAREAGHRVIRSLTSAMPSASIMRLARMRSSSPATRCRTCRRVRAIVIDAFSAIDCDEHEPLAMAGPSARSRRRARSAAGTSPGGSVTAADATVPRVAAGSAPRSLPRRSCGRSMSRRSSRSTSPRLTAERHAFVVRAR